MYVANEFKHKPALEPILVDEVTGARYGISENGVKDVLQEVSTGFAMDTGKK